MDCEWLKAQFRVNPERSKAELAAYLKLGAPAVSKMLMGQRQIKAAEYLAMRRFFGLSTLPEDAGARSLQSSFVLPPLSNMREGESDNTPGPDDWVIPGDLIRAHTKAPPEKIRIFEVPDNAMLPDFRLGEQVLVDTANLKPSPSGVFVMADGFGQMIRHVEFVPHSQPPAVRIATRQAGMEAQVFPLDKVTLLGRVIAKLQWL